MQMIRTVCDAVRRPFNVGAEGSATALSVNELAAVGVKRITLGATLFLTAYGAFVRVAREIMDSGTFRGTSDALPFSELEEIFEPFE